MTILWEEVRVKDVLANAGGMPDADTIFFYAPERYSTSLSLGYSKDRDILLRPNPPILRFQSPT